MSFANTAANPSNLNPVLQAVNSSLNNAASSTKNANSHWKPLQQDGSEPLFSMQEAHSQNADRAGMIVIGKDDGGVSRNRKDGNNMDSNV